MVRRAPSKILRVGGAHGTIWASGVFSNMAEWCADHRIQRVVCLLRWEDSDLRWQVPHYTHMDFNEELVDRVLEVLRDITDTIYSGGDVLVHCKHGLHRTGAIITLWIALSLATGDMCTQEEQQSERSVLSNKPWVERLEEAFEAWSRGRQLKQASIEGKGMIHLTSMQIMKTKR